MSTAAATSTLREIPLAAIIFSTSEAQTERRKRFDKAGLAELVESVRSAGVIQPILVRPFRDEHVTGDAYELIAGERRVMAARQAGLEAIPANIRELTDQQVLELQLIENLQREGLHELIEAEGYEALMKRHGYTVEDLVVKVGKSRSYVYQRLKLVALCAEGRKAFHEGKLSGSTALYVARIPAQLQKQAIGEVTKLQRTYFGDGDEDRSPMSSRQAQKHIHDNYMLKLSDAGFKTGDPELVPAAGPCSTCPKRTGNQPELFGDVKGADVCTDPVCFKQKIAAHAERAIAAAAQSGQTVISGADAKKVAKHGADSYLEGYVRLDARDHERKGTYRQTLGKAYVPTLLHDPESGKLIEVAPDKDIAKAHGDKERTATDRDRYAERRRTEERKHREQIIYRGALFKAIHEAGVARKSLTRVNLEQVAERLFERLDHDSKKRLFAALVWEITKRQPSTEFEFPTPVAKMSDGELAQLIRDCAIAHELQVWQHSGETRPKDMEAAAAELGVDPKKVRAQLAAAQKAKATARSKPKAKARKKGKASR